MGERRKEEEKRTKVGPKKERKAVPKLWLLLNLDYSLETYPMVK